MEVKYNVYGPRDKNGVRRLESSGNDLAGAINSLPSGLAILASVPLAIFAGMHCSAIGNTLYVKNKGSGIKIRKVGQGLHLSPWKKHYAVSGAVLYLKPQGGGYVDGSGLMFGPNSPLAKIPILGDLLGWLL